METKYKVIIGVVVVATAFATGRYTTPEKIRIETKIVEVEKKVTDETTDTKKKKRKKTTTVIITKPDGTKEEHTEITDDVDTDKTKVGKEVDDLTKNESTVNQSQRGDSKVTISGLAGLDILTGKTVFGASVTKPVLGPITLGAWGMTNSTAGFSLGLTF